MNIGLIGKGRMGTLVGSLVQDRGHRIHVVISAAEAGSDAAELSKKLDGLDVVIDFSSPNAVVRNVEACVRAGVPLVEGTTGWNERRDAIKATVREGNGALVFGANFSIGVNLFYRIASFAAELLAKFPEYEAFIEEQHHSRKKDAPSGTALKLKEIVSQRFSSDIGVSATRAGNIPGTHRVGFDGLADQILLEHFARSREGFVTGAILAAEWIVGKTGFFDFAEVMDEICRGRDS